MPDLLAHALLAYIIATLLSWRHDWLDGGYVTVAMAGAFIPDLAKAELLMSSSRITQLLGLPFDWSALHTAGGALVSVLIGTVIVVPEERKRVFGLLAIGASSHLVADAFLRTATGHSYPILWPLTRYHPPTPGLYLSTQPEPTIGIGIVAVAIWLTTRYW